MLCEQLQQKVVMRTSWEITVTTKHRETLNGSFDSQMFISTLS